MASRIALDLSKFKHVKSDDKSTTLQHKDGHLLTMAHAALSPKFREQLGALSKLPSEDQTSDQKQEASSDYGKVTVKEDKPQPLGKVVMKADGGEVDRDQGGSAGMSKQQAQDMTKGAQQEGTSLSEGVKNIANEVKSYFAEGTPKNTIQPQDQSQVDAPVVAENATAQDTQQNQVDPAVQRKREIYNALVSSRTQGADASPFMFGDKGESPTSFDSTTWDQAEQDYSGEQAQNAAQSAQSQQQAIQTNKNRVAAGLDPIQVPNVPQGPQSPGTNLNPVSQTPGQPAPPPGVAGSQVSDDAAVMQEGLRQQLLGQKAEAVQKGVLGEAQAKALDDTVKAQQLNQIEYKRAYGALDQERQDHISDIQNNLIDPNKYWTGNPNSNPPGEGGHSKIAAGIGMILAGFNPTSNPNAAVNFLKFQMEQSLEGQKQNLGAKQNLLQANLRQFGNLQDATNVTKLMMADTLNNQLQSAASTAQGPLAKAAAQAAGGALMQTYAPLHQQLALKQNMMSMFNQPTQNTASASPDARELAWQQANNRMMLLNPELARVMAEKHVPGIGDASIPVPQETRDKLVAMNTLDAKAQDLLAYARANKGSVDPAVIKVGSQKAEEMKNFYNNSINGGVMTEGRLAWLDQQIKRNPTSIFQDVLGNNKQLEEIANSNATRRNQLMSSVGLPVPKQQAAPKFKTVNGVKYQRGPNGQAIPVK